MASQLLPIYFILIPQFRPYRPDVYFLSLINSLFRDYIVIDAESDDEDWRADQLSYNNRD